VQEIEDSLIENLKRRILGNKGFKVADKPMKIYGYCSRCRLISKKTGNFIDISSKEG
jgi:Fe2+ or Zn2+ uptake regulation protein